MMMMMMRSLILLASVVLSSSAYAQSVTTLNPNHPDRRAISVLLKEGRGDVIEPFRIAKLRLAKTKAQDFAYVDTQSTYDQEIRSFHSILARKKGGKWRTIWSEGSGGSNSCADGIRHYEWAFALFKKNAIKVSEFAPEMLTQFADMQQTAKTDGGDIQCAGDFDGGAEGVQ
jgi:hypothetical protein